MANSTKLKAHLFICTNEKKDNKESCSQKNSEKPLFAQLKQYYQDKNLWGTEVRITKSGCLGHCQEGIVAVLYPHGEWKFNLRETDFPQLVKWIEEKL